MSAIIKTLSTQVWLARHFGDEIQMINARRDLRRQLTQNHEARPKGKGNRWQRRLREMETQFRTSGGGYLSDLIA